MGFVKCRPYRRARPCAYQRTLHSYCAGPQTTGNTRPIRGRKALLLASSSWIFPYPVNRKIQNLQVPSLAIPSPQAGLRSQLTYPTPVG